LPYALRDKRIALAMAILFALAIVLPFAGAAEAAAGYKALQAPSVSDGEVVNLGNVLVEVPAGAVSNGHFFIFSLPNDDFEFRQGLPGADPDVSGSEMTEANWNDGGINNISIPAEFDGKTNGFKGASFAFSKLDNHEIKATVSGLTYAGENVGYFYINLDAVYVQDGFEGDVTLTAYAPGSSGFSSSTGGGPAVVGKASSGMVRLAVQNAPSFSTDTTEDSIIIRVTEAVKGSIEEGEDSIKFVLPTGFEFTGTPSYKTIWGSPNYVNFTHSFNTKKTEISFKNVAAFPSATNFEIELDIAVADETRAKTGEVKVNVRGESDFSVSELVVANYGQYGIKITAEDAPEVYSGILEQEIADFTVKEDVAASLIAGRSVIFTLPSNAKWGKLPTSVKDQGVELELQGFPGRDGEAARYTVKGASNKAAELEFEDMEIVLEPGAKGDVVVNVTGTAGVTGDITVAKAVAPVTASASTKTVVTIGAQAQEVGEIVITEAAAGVIMEGAILVELPTGVKFATTPKVEVTEGDLDVDVAGVKRQDSDTELRIPVDNESNDVSTIKISGINYTVDRTVAEGDIEVKFKGDALVDVNTIEEIEGYYGNADVNDYVKIGGFEAFKLDDEMIFPATSTAAKAANATVGTPAPIDKAITAKFVIGSTTYTVDGVEQTMDVAPYVKDGRTYLPVRYVANSLGVDNDNIMWDSASGTVTLIKGDKVVQVKVGSKNMIINGATIAMDAAPEITDGRTMLPFRWIAWAFGADVQWDGPTQTVTMEL